LEHNETIWTSAQLWWCGYVIRMDNCTMAPGVLVGELLVHWQFISLTRQFTNNTFCWQLASWVHLSTLLRSCHLVSELFCQQNVEEASWFVSSINDTRMDYLKVILNQCSITSAQLETLASDITDRRSTCKSAIQDFEARHPWVGGDMWSV